MQKFQFGNQNMKKRIFLLIIIILTLLIVGLFFVFSTKFSKNYTYVKEEPFEHETYLEIRYHWFNVQNHELGKDINIEGKNLSYTNSLDYPEVEKKEVILSKDDIDELVDVIEASNYFSLDSVYSKEECNHSTKDGWGIWMHVSYGDNHNGINTWCTDKPIKNIQDKIFSFIEK